MRVLIVEDEPLAQDKLIDLLKQYDSDIQITDTIDSIKEAKEVLKKDPELDLIFLDIQLSDGLCFEIFKDIQIDQPVIFTTAYDQYALEAFKLNSIDYLLKPISYDELETAMKKFAKLSFQAKKLDRQMVEEIVSSMQKKTRKRFLVRVGNSMQFVSSEDIAYFQADDKIVYLCPQERKDRFIVDHTMEELEHMLDPEEFFRINRKFIVRMDAISAIHTYFNSRLILDLNTPVPTDVIVSRERVSDFKNWLNT